jgi:hypothetical protein
MVAGTKVDSAVIVAIEKIPLAKKSITYLHHLRYGLIAKNVSLMQLASQIDSCAKASQKLYKKSGLNTAGSY